MVTLILRSIEMQLSIHSHYIQVLSLSNHGERVSDLYLDQKWPNILLYEMDQLKMASFGRRSVAILGSCLFALAFVFDTTSYSNTLLPFRIGVGICFSLLIVRVLVKSYTWLYPSKEKKEYKERRMRDSGSIDLLGSNRITSMMSYMKPHRESNTRVNGEGLSMIEINGSVGEVNSTRDPIVVESNGGESDDDDDDDTIHNPMTNHANT